MVVFHPKRPAKKMKNQDWSRDEHILALDFYLRHTPKIPSKASLEVVSLSTLLNKMQERLGGDRTQTFRNPSGVYMKLMNFRRFDPGYSGKGLPNGNKDEETVWNLYADKPVELANLAARIANFVTAPGPADQETLPSLDAAEEEGEEGGLLSRVHRYRERNKGLVGKKKQQFLSSHINLFCEVCGFNFEKAYGERGKGFIECHHTKPVSQLEPGEKTKLVDLVLLCSNCHRVVHRHKPWLSIDALRAQIENAKAGS
jgi:5-methylcytosine-specific restriction enzyme A